MNGAEIAPPPELSPEAALVTVTVVVAESLRLEGSVTVRRN
jgi:hypothetical protein